MKRILTAICMLTVLFLLNRVSFAASPPPDVPLFQLLAFVPIHLDGDLVYVDFAAIEQAYPPAHMPEDWNEYAALTPDTAEQQLPLDVWNRVFLASGTPFTDAFSRGEGMPAAMGIDWFQTRRALLAGANPGQIIYLQGDFDIEAVRAALTERSFALDSTVEDLELWCGADGCEHSHEPNLDRIEQGDIFGGSLGQEWARLISSDLLIGTNVFESAEQIVSVLAGETRNLADYDPVRAAVAALSDQGVVLQAVIPGAALQRQFDYPPISPSMTREQALAEINALLDAGYETLPPFEIMMFASIVSETEQILQVAFVYSTADEAEAAARIIPARLESYRSYDSRQPIARTLEQMRVSRIDTEIVTTEIYPVVRLTLATPKATAEEIVALGPSLHRPDVATPGALFNFLQRLYYRQELSWLSTTTREQLIELANRLG